MTILYICLIIVATSLLTYALDRRQQYLFRQENETRERLGLPPLTEAEFSLKVVEKSADYRGTVNQHM